jgi:signal transduction histidine kinase/ActR/RegA family two-component response regulator
MEISYVIAGILRINSIRAPKCFNYINSICLALVLSATVCFSTTSLTVRDTKRANDAGLSAEFLVDKDKSFTIKDVSGPEKSALFKPSKTKTPNFGFSTAAYWARLTIIDSTDNGGQWVLECATPNIHYVDLYVPDDSGGFQVQKSGFMIPSNKRPFSSRNPAFLLNLSSKKPLTVYLRFESETSILLPLALYHVDNYKTHEQKTQDFLGMYFGALLIMALYNLYLLFTLRDRTYLYLVSFILTFAFGQMISVYGYFVDNWIAGFPLSIFQYLHLPTIMAILAAIFLGRSMFASSTLTPKIDKLLLGIAACIAVFSSTAPFLKFRVSELVIVHSNLIVNVPVFIIAVIAYRKKYRPAVYFILAYLVTGLGLVLYNLMYGFNVLPFSTFLYFVPNIAFIITILLFSLGLTDRINIIKQEREHARSVALQNLKQAVQFQGKNKQLEEELFQKRKLEAIGQLSSGVTHDINNMLTPILGYAGLIKIKSDNPGLAADYSEKIAIAARQIRDLVAKLLLFSRKKAAIVRPVDLHRLITELMGLLEHTIDKRIQIRTFLQADNPILIGDPSALQNALLNLSVNAKDAMPEGGVLTFTTGLADLNKDDDLCRNFGVESGEYIYVSVCDTGTGIDQETLSKIFEPFFTTKPVGKGTGLGLAGVYGCVKSHNGCIDVKTEVGNGTTFVLYFPHVKEICDEMELSDSHYTVQAAHILFVDDETYVREIGVEVLRELGYQVDCCRDGEEAVAFYKKEYSNIDLVILDMLMPKMSGLDCFIELRKINQGVKVLVMSGYMEHGDLQSVVQNGACGILEKPFEMNTLSTAISRALQGSSVYR